MHTPDETPADGPPPPPPARRSYASASAQPKQQKSSPPPPVPPKHASLQPHAPAPVQTSSFFAYNSSSSTPPLSANSDRRASGSFRPAGSASKRTSQAWAKQPGEDDALEVEFVQERSHAGRAPTSSVREVEPGEAVGEWQDEWVTSGRTWNEQVEVAHRSTTSPSANTSPPFELDPPGYSTFAELPSLPVATPAPAPPSNYFYHSPDSNDSRNGLWTVPRVLALPGNAEGGFAGIWQYAVLDFPLNGKGPVRDTPAGEKASGSSVYRAMGEYIDVGREEVEAEAQAAAEELAATEDTPMVTPEDGADEAALLPPVRTVDDALPTSASPAVPPKLARARKGFSTITRDELTNFTRPHPHLYFCRETFSWVLAAPLPPTPAPTSIYNSSSLNLSDAPELWAEISVDPQDAERFLTDRLDPPLPRPIGPADHSSFSMEAPPYAPWTPGTAEGALLELKGLKGSRAVVSSQAFYPTVIGKHLWLQLLKKRGEDPPVGKTADDAKWNSVRFLWRALDNILFVGETRSLPTTGNGFRRNMPMDETTNDIFIATLGFKYENDLLTPPSIDERTPQGRQARQRLLRAWFEISCWMEKTATMDTARAVFMGSTRVEWRGARDRLAAAIGGDNLARIPSSDPFGTPAVFQLPHQQNRRNADNLDPCARQYGILGVVPDVTDDVIIKVYDVQVLHSPEKGPHYLEALRTIADSRSSSTLNEKVALESSLDRYTSSEIEAAYKELHLSSPFDLYTPINTEDELYTAFEKRNSTVEHATRRRVLLEAAKVVANYARSDLLKAAIESVPMPMMEGETSVALVKAKMDPARAYVALGVEESTPDDFVEMIFPIRLQDATSDSDKDKAREALEVIANLRKSDRLKALLRDGKNDSVDQWQSISINPDLPVGLTNIANTCYLNSLLQYFFTVRELRETILAYDAAAPSPVEGEERPTIRVGGRLVSESEVQRSKKFVTLLQNLYLSLIHSPNAVTPETELAYLALVPSKEEEALAVASSSTSQPSTTAATSKKVEEITLVDSPSASGETVKSPGGTVLGKRKNGAEGRAEGNEEMVLDSQPSASPAPAGDADMTDVPPSPSSASSTLVQDSQTSSASIPAAPVDSDLHQPKRGRSLDPTRDTHGYPSGPNPDVEVVPASPTLRDDEEMPPLTPGAASSSRVGPALPPRPQGEKGKDSKEKEAEREIQSYMAFGRQNDVTECMDNVMFQVEAALLASAAKEGRNGEEEEKANLLKRTFYGLSRQTVTFTDPSSVSDPIRTQLEPFSSLLVDVPPASSTHPALQRDLYDALDTVFASEDVTLESHPATRRSGLLARGKNGEQLLPTLLQVQLQRVQFDREKGRVFKSNAHLKLPEVLDVGRYVDDDEGEEGEDEEKRSRREKTEGLRRELGRRKARLEELVTVKTSSTAASTTTAPSLLRSTLEHFTSLASSSSSSSNSIMSSSTALAESFAALLPTSLVEDTSAEALALEKEIEEAEKRVGEIKGEMEGLWAEVGQGGGERGEGEGATTKYELCSVFIHRGTASSGHYYIYQRDSRNTTRWLKYNDSLVSEVLKDDVFKDTKGDTNPYFLVYVRQDRLDAIESIKREA